MKYIRKSTPFLLIGLIFMIMGGAPFLWMQNAAATGTAPKWLDVETAKRIGQVFGALGGVGAAVFLSGLFRRIFRSKVDRADLRLVNFVLRFSFVFLMFGALIFASLWAFQNFTPEMMPYIEPYRENANFAMYGLLGLGTLLFVFGLMQKKPTKPIHISK